MGNEKILKVMAEVNGEVCERGELIHGIALALLTRKHLFVLGDVGQAKSYAIDRFCKRITGAKQFSTLMNKQTDTEQLFGRLDLASLIPGHLPSSVIDGDPIFSDMKNSGTTPGTRYIRMRLKRRRQSLRFTKRAWL